MRWIFAITVLPACTLQAPAPEIRALSPDKGWTGETTGVSISGKYFYPNVVVDPSKENGGTIDGSFEAYLVADDESHQLTGVYHVSYEDLHADVPPALDPGLYDLRVVTPSGLEATLEDAYTVTATQADRLELTPEMTVYEAGETASVTVSLRDRNGDVVEQAMPVVVTVSSDDDLEDVVLLGVGLDDAVVAGDALSMTGTLLETGEGTFSVNVRQPHILTLEVEAVDPVDPVPGDSAKITWTTGAVADVVVDLPRDEGFRTIAGDTFEVGFTLLDENQNEITDQDRFFLLTEECGAFQGSVRPLLDNPIEVTLTTACAENRIRAWDGENEWFSPTFTVLPAEPAAFVVDHAPDTVTAGDDALLLDIVAIDAYGNTVSDYEEEIELMDDVGGLDPARGVGTVQCDGFPEVGEAEQFCVVSLWKAEPEVHVLVSDSGGLLGVSSAIEVVPGDPVSIDLDTDAGEVAAGETFTMEATAVDDFGNLVEWDPGGADVWTFEEETGTIGCTWTGEDEGVQTFACVLTAASDSVPVVLHALELRGVLADPLRVVNGDLALVDVTPRGSGFVAGTPFVADLYGFDAYGNPYEVQSDPVVALEDSTGTFAPTEVTLDGIGEGTVSVTITQAGTATTLSASQGGTVLGTSDPFTVSAATLSSLQIEAPAWISVDEGGEVTVIAVDTYGNPVTSYAGTVALVTRDGGCDSTETDAFTDGVAIFDVVCASPEFADVFYADDGEGTEGMSGLFDVVDFDCDDGPTAELLLDDDTTAVVCLSSSEATVEVDASGSVSGASTIAVYHVSDGDGGRSRAPADTTTLEYDTAGVRDVELVVVAGDACADFAEARVYVGEDDGSPAGPVEVEAADAAVSAGSGTEVTVVAYDCRGDVAASEDLAVRADLGDVEAESTGEGLVVELDADGTATFGWDFALEQDGDGTLLVGKDGASGSAAVTVSGESRLPQVVEMTPAGAKQGTVSRLYVEIDDDVLDYASLYTAATLTGPDGTVDVDVTIGDDGRTLELRPESTVDAGAGIWTLTLTDDVRDAAGNRLDGGWTGARGSFVGTFGDVPVEASAMAVCDADVSRFVPDGDDGEDEESDDVTIDVAAGATATWWWWRVYDVTDELVVSGRVGGDEEQISWDGRDPHGLVVPSGAYSIEIVEVDDWDNAGDPCTVDVTVDQHVESP